MSTPRVFGIAGWKNSGKTGLAVRLVEEFTRRGYRISTIKHAHHDFDIDKVGADSYRHRQAGAHEVTIVSGDKVAIRWSAEGTHTGPLGDAPPTGKRVRIEGLLFDRVVDGCVAERWEQWDQPGMLRQLGFA